MAPPKNNLTRRDFIQKASCASVALWMAGNLGMSTAHGSSVRIAAKNAVPTLTGSVDSQALGTTLMHEHILLGNVPKELQKQTIDIAVKLLNDAARAGLTTLVDVVPFDSYCNTVACDWSIAEEYAYKLELYQAIAAQTPVNIIVSTGFYRYEKAPQEIRNMSEAKMEERMLRAITEGIGNTKIRAGIIKLAADRSTLTDWEKKAFRAAARVQKATGVPIATHASQGAVEQFDLLVQHGANPAHLNFAHIETEVDWEGRNREQTAEHLLHIPKEGGYLLFNNFSCEFYTPWTDMVYLMRYYCDKGYTNRLLISEDCNWEWKKGRQVFEKEEEYPDAAKRTYAYALTHEVPLMKLSGFTEKEITTFLVTNPADFFRVEQR